MIAATIRFVSSLALTVSAPVMPTQSPAAPPPAAARAPGVPGLVALDVTPKVLVEGLKFAEGPAADAAGNVMFCDLATSEVFRLVHDVGTWRGVRVAE
jgi:hypothetical protein